jgi:hypothetical protein
MELSLVNLGGIKKLNKQYRALLVQIPFMELSIINSRDIKK